MWLWIILGIINILFVISSTFYLYNFIWPTLKMMHEIIYKADASAIKLIEIATDLDADYLKIEKLIRNLHGEEEVDAVIQGE